MVLSHYSNADRVSQEVKGDPEKTIFVTRLSHRTTQGEYVGLNKKDCHDRSCIHSYLNSQHTRITPKRTLCTHMHHIYTRHKHTHNQMSYRMPLPNTER